MRSAGRFWRASTAKGYCSSQLARSRSPMSWLLPDADQTPEMLVGLSPGVPAEAQFARRLAESGCRVVVPMLIDRASTYSIGAAGARPTNQPHREFVYRHAFELGRHVIGYEVQKVLALVDWFYTVGDTDTLTVADTQIGVIGYGEGGLLALYAAALDTSIDAVCTSGYFAPRENVWQEPIYRNVFGLLDEFGDAEVATLVAPRTLVIEACRSPRYRVRRPPSRAQERAPGKIVTPPTADVQAEAKRAAALVGTKWSPDGRGQRRWQRTAGHRGGAREIPGRAGAASTTCAACDRADAQPAGLQPGAAAEAAARPVDRSHPAAFARGRIHPRATSGRRRIASRARSRSGKRSTAPYRKYFYDEVIGRFDRPLLPRQRPHAQGLRRSRRRPATKSCSTCSPTCSPTAFCCVPKDMKPGERRPVVVCQHGLEGRPQVVADPKANNPAYNQFAVPAGRARASSPSRRRTRTSSRTASARCSARRTR